MTANAEPVITPKIANHALHHFNSEEGFSGGYVSDRFFELCVHADDAYLARLAEGFPAEIAAFELGKSEAGLSMLRVIGGFLSTVN